MKSLKARVLWFTEQLFDAIVKHPLAVLLIGLLLAIFSAVFAFRNLTFLPNFAGLNNNETSYSRNYQAFIKEFNQEPAMVVVAKGDHVERNEAFLEALAQKLSVDPAIERIIYKVNLRPFESWAMAYLSPPNLKKVVVTLETAKPLFSQMNSRPNLVQFWQTILGLSQSQTGVGNPQGDITGLAALKRMVDLMTEQVEGRKGNLLLTGPFQALTGLPESQYHLARKNGNYELYLTLQDGKYAFLSAYAVKDKEGVALLEPAVARIRKAMSDLAPQFPDVETHLTGEPVMGVDEMIVAKHDMLVAGLISFFLSAAIFVLGFMELRKPILSIVSLFIGVGWSLGYITLSVKHLNVFTISLFPMLIGLAIDFSIQFMGRYREERTKLSPEEAIRKTYFSTGTGLLAAAATTALGFFAITFAKYTGIAELGTATGGSLLLCFLSTMTILPALLLLTERKGEQIQGKSLTMGIRTEKFLLSKASFVVLAAAVLTFFLVFEARRISFDHNILNLEAKGTDSVKTELELISVASKSSIFAIMVADNPEQAAKYVNELQTLSTVSSIQSPLAFIPHDQEKKLPLLKKIQQLMQGFDVTDPNTPVDVKALGATFQKMKSLLQGAQAKMATTGGALGLLKIFIFPGNDLFHGSEQTTDKQLAEISDALSSFQKSVVAFLDALRKADPKEAASLLTGFQNDFFDQIHSELELIRNGIPTQPVTLSDLPPIVRNQFIGKTGKIMIQIFPSQNIWERAELERFISQLKTVDPDVTGAPILIYETTKELLESYKHAAWIAIVVIALVTFVKFRNLYLTLLTLFPLCAGFLWLVGIMVLFHKSFNPANLITLPVILGIGVAFGVYVVNRFCEEQQPSIFSTSTGRSVLLSAMTSIAGFASLLFVSHQGLQSLGFAMTTGLSAITFQALIVLPSLIKVTARKHP